MTTPEIQWNDTVTMDRALQILGYATRPEWLDAHVAAGRARGAWDANEREYYVAYRSIAAALEVAP